MAQLHLIRQDELDQARLPAICTTFEEALGFLRLANQKGVTVQLVHGEIDEIPDARVLYLDICGIEDPKDLVKFVCACHVLAEVDPASPGCPSVSDENANRLVNETAAAAQQALRGF